MEKSAHSRKGAECYTNDSKYIIYMNLVTYNTVAFKKHYSNRNVLGLFRTGGYIVVRYCFKQQIYKFPV